MVFEQIPFYIYGIIFAILLLVVLLRMRISRRRRRLSDANPRKISIRDIDQMTDGSEFEQYLFRFVSGLGYKEVHKTTSSRDFGADLVFTDSQGKRTVVQAKRYSQSHPVGLSAVQEVYSSMRYYEAERAVVLTSGRYTEACRILAGVNGVLLLDRNDLIELIECYKSKQWEDAAAILEDEPEARTERWSGKHR
ncbi:restriction endonuclease [Paenibacillus donghaensis]|uniref:Endonuclease n=1 Tax=Paenibacillus donghaensis TaxID=414771 RepID=A0A2Z2KQL1_9BACL|nr:restriction endonuclease [Paenibacillus donghaensis]ASA21168.1 endonuclease [Paenibacillus donghaensis]